MCHRTDQVLSHSFEEEQDIKFRQLKQNFSSLKGCGKKIKLIIFHDFGAICR